MMRRLSLIIPAFNEELKIAHDLKETVFFLSQQTFSSEMILVDDGSQDRTRQVAEKIAESLSTEQVQVRVLSYSKNQGKGYAIRRGLEGATGEILGFMDSGLCVPLRFILEGIRHIQEGAECAIASRRLKASLTIRRQPLYRRVGSQVFWKGMKAWMGIEVSDTQCGFKFYRADAARKIFSEIATKGFMFDIEALLLAKHFGMKTVEFPVEWANDEDTRYHPVWGTLRNLKELVQMKRRLSSKNSTAVHR